MSFIKNKKDFGFGLVSLAVSVFLLLSDGIVIGRSLFPMPSMWAKADTYVRIIAAVMAALSLVLVIRSFLKGEEGEEGRKNRIDYVVIIFFAAMTLYLVLMDALGFVINSIWLMTLITLMIRMREKRVDVHDKQAVLKSLGISLLYAAILVLVASFVFSTWLKVTLP